jgi:transposase
MPQQKRKPYPTDLSDKEWALIAPLVPPPKYGGRNRYVDVREVLDAIFYLLRTGCAWRMLPHDFPEWQTARTYFDMWKKDGTWKKMHDTLRGKVRKKRGKEDQPTAGIIDSQSVKTAEKGGFVAMTLVKR